jgi:hypothetical protein
MHATEVITEYEAPVAVPMHKLLLIKVDRSVWEHHSLLDVVRFAWKIHRRRAEAADYVLGVQRGLIIGAFVADCWLSAGSESIEKRVGNGPYFARHDI